MNKKRKREYLEVNLVLEIDPDDPFDCKWNKESLLDDIYYNYDICGLDIKKCKIKRIIK